MNRLITAVVLLSAAAPALAQGRIVDRVTPKKGPAVEGVIQKETYKEVVIQVGSSNTTFAPADVLRVEYGDAPPSLKGAMADIEAGSYDEALNKINNSETYLSDLKREKKSLPRAWCEQHIAFHRALCLREIARGEPKRLDDAIVWFTKVIDTWKDSRFLTEAYGGLLECLSEKGDSAAMDALIKKIDAAPNEVKIVVKKKAELMKAESLLGSGQTDQAKNLYEQLSRDSDREIAAEGVQGVIRCLQQGKKTDQLATFCKGVLNTMAHEPGLLLLASNALADSLLEQKKLKEAAKQFVDSVVRYHPGRGSRLAREHERALFQLGSTYEALAGAASDDGAKKAYQLMAGRTYRELAIEYPLGKYKDQANARAADLDK